MCAQLFHTLSSVVRVFAISERSVEQGMPC